MCVFITGNSWLRVSVRLHACQMLEPKVHRQAGVAITNKLEPNRKSIKLLFTLVASDLDDKDILQNRGPLTTELDAHLAQSLRN